MPKQGFRVALVLQQEVVGVLLLLREGGVEWARGVGSIESIPNRSGYERFLPPGKNQEHQTHHHDDLSRSLHEGPGWILYLLFYLNSGGHRHLDWIRDVGANLGLKVGFGLHTHDCSCGELVT